MEDLEETAVNEIAATAYPFVPACQVYPLETADVHFPQLNETGTRQFLSAFSWPIGLQELYIKSCKSVPMRYVIVDDSGSMSTCDGRRVVVEGSKQGFVNCSRWSELTESLRFHANLAEASRAPTEFRLLNSSVPVMVGCGDDNGEGLNRVMTLFDQSPCGRTPLCAHINSVVEHVKLLAPQLRASGQRAVLIIATDGLASDGDIMHAMKPLQYLPVWVVVRLCTDESSVCEYWNGLDCELEIDMDVLDDFETEAGEIFEKNNWFTYGEPLHRLREFGVLLKDIDLVDEVALGADQMRDILAIISVGCKPSDIPHPDVDWTAFLTSVRALIERTPVTWCPIQKTTVSWIRLNNLIRRYSGGRDNSCSLM